MLKFKDHSTKKHSEFVYRIMLNRLFGSDNYINV